MPLNRETLIKIGLRHHNRFAAQILKFFPEEVFFELHRWPRPFPWTKKNVSFCLSFDCDNPGDADVLPDLISQLQHYDLPASFAVCGAIIKENLKKYKEIVAKGYEIINHGYTKHVNVRSDGLLHPVFFYESLSLEQIEEEIVRNHEFLQKFLGVSPVGFRVPHFGSFQKAHQLEWLYAFLRKHHYRYSSSVQIAYAKERGYLEGNRDIIEFPLSARVGMPFSVFDSWGFLEKSSRKLKEDLFVKEFKWLVDTALRSRHPVFLNIYFDPSHVTGYKGLEECLSYLCDMRDRIWIGNYSDIVKRGRI